MTRTRKIRWRELVVLLAALVCAATWAAGQVRSMRDRSEVANMTENMKTICVGRFLVDVPAKAEISLSHERVAGFEIETVEENEAAFKQRIAERESDIGGRGPATDGTGGMVETRDLRVAGMTGRTFIYGLNRGYTMKGDQRIDDEYVSVEVHGHIDGLSFSLSAKYGDEDRARLGEAMLARLRLRAEDEIPSDAGFCIWRAIFVDPLPISKAEHAALHVSLPEHPDVALTFASLPAGGTARDLLERIADIDADASADELLRVTKLRIGRRSINGLPGDEVLERMRELNFATTYAFMWEAQGVADDPARPFLSLELQGGVSPRSGGKPVNTSLHEDAVLALWDRISSSIRMRPFGAPPGPASPPEPPVPELGTTVHAGEACPQSGWWRCNEGGPGIDVQGGVVQYIRKGEFLPQALLLPRPTMWQTLRGIQPSIEPSQPTVWKLVDKRQRPRTPAIVALAPALPGGDVPKEQTIVGRPIAVGDCVRTGETCPASGWWRCEEAYALDGARWFPGGSLLPAATFLVPRRLFGSGAGPDVIQRRSTWRLMRLAAAESVTLPARQSPMSQDDANVVPAGPTTLA